MNDMERVKQWKSDVRQAAKEMRMIKAMVLACARARKALDKYDMEMPSFASYRDETMPAGEALQKVIDKFVGWIGEDASAKVKKELEGIIR